MIALLTSELGSNMFLSNKHSLGTPTVSMEGPVRAGIERPTTPKPGSTATEVCPTTGAADKPLMLQKVKLLSNKA